MNIIQGIGLAAGLGLLAACADKEIILQGKRLPIRDIGPFASSEGDTAAEVEVAAFDTALGLPAPTVNAAWTQTAGGPTHSIAHPAFTSNPQLVWTAGIGQGNDRKHRIAGDPVVADGRIFTLDSRARVTATSTAGQTLWARDLTPPSDRDGDASGGGVAVAGNRVYATTGFGQVAALDAATGAEIWRQDLAAPATSSPAILGDLIYVVSRDNQAWAIRTDNGRVQWTLPGTPSQAGVVGGAGPAVTEQVAIFPFGSGEIVAALRQGGVRIWGATVAGQRKGRAYANITDIAADPVVVDGVIYTANQSGRAVAIDAGSGNRIWTATHGAYGPVSVAGGSVFLISDQSKLVRLDAASGTEIWSRDLPYFRRERTRKAKAIFAHYGPVLAGGALWVASDDGTLKSYDPATGADRARVELPGGAASNMAVAGRTMYVLSERGQLHAFR